MFPLMKVVGHYLSYDYETGLDCKYRNEFTFRHSWTSLPVPKRSIMISFVFSRRSCNCSSKDFSICTAYSLALFANFFNLFLVSSATFFKKFQEDMALFFTWSHTSLKPRRSRSRVASGCAFSGKALSAGFNSPSTFLHSMFCLENLVNHHTHSRKNIQLKNHSPGSRSPAIPQ